VVADNVCPLCLDGPEPRDLGPSATELMVRLLSCLPEDHWGEILPKVLLWNRRHHGLPDETIFSMFESLKKLEKATQ
jgi:hypothetical protein